jgi:hypothetical protein
MIKDTKKFCNRFSCHWNNKAKCTQQKLIGKNNKCIFYEEHPGERCNQLIAEGK